MAYISPVISINGLTIPSYQDVLDYLIAQKKAIYGTDIYLEVDSPDYQEMSVFALMIYDVLLLAQMIYNNRDPLTAIGAALDAIIKINGLARNIATHSTVDLTVTGTAGTVITNGIAEDDAGTEWYLPASVTIPLIGYIIVTATAADAGDVTALAGTITKIKTPVSGWISVTNASSATPGNAVETDASIRSRQAFSTAIPSLSVMEGIAGAIYNITGVTQAKYYENTTDATDINGVPAHSIAFIIEGGDTTEIVTTLATKKTPGTGFYGTTEQVYYDEYGVPMTVKFFRPAYVTIDIEVRITALFGFTTATEDVIKEALYDYINSLEIGQDVLWSRLIGASLLTGVENSETFNVTSVELAVHGSSPYSLDPNDITIAFNERAITELTNITIVTT